ncbi:type II toxin-antitoxin system HicB family antitoxin [Bradyrhizobium jicamae]|uniref:type II toxin-antitoxin system HicB family antitoxin n=1 Tax=Bradyrhizobium jicamae TaxID=280332 RepID=UPI001BA9BB7B|nr:type II toxin-antitoxin system HicB family antitoxin [Bradyrhizobium jicamae]MBR0754911.1 type II toxin-antitoxin system HicB family antitoxin [Bradyrhizobium jicamae]
MRTFTYAAKFEQGDEQGIVVSFPDVPEAITQGDDMADARAQAEEALGLALLTYPERGMSLPKARAKGKGFTLITVAPGVAAKLAVLEAFKEAGIGKSELGRRMGKDEKEIRRVLDPKHPTKLPTMVEALRALGKRLIVSVEEAA